MNFSHSGLDFKEIKKWYICLQKKKQGLPGYELWGYCFSDYFRSILKWRLIKSFFFLLDLQQLKHLYQNEGSNFYRGGKLIVHVRHDRDNFRQVSFDHDFVEVDVDESNLEKSKI